MNKWHHKYLFISLYHFHSILSISMRLACGFVIRKRLQPVFLAASLYSQAVNFFTIQRH